QIVGMDWHPVLKQLYFTENQRDWLSGTYRRKSSTASPVPARTISAFPTAIKETSPISSSAGVTIAPRSSPNRSRCSDHIQPRSGCASTPGTCFHVSITTSSLSRDMALEQDQKDRWRYRSSEVEFEWVGK